MTSVLNTLKGEATVNSRPWSQVRRTAKLRLATKTYIGRRDESNLHRDSILNYALTYIESRWICYIAAGSLGPASRILDCE